MNINPDNVRGNHYHISLTMLCDMTFTGQKKNLKR